MYNKFHLDVRDFRNILISKKYANSTIKNYTHHLMQFLTCVDKQRSHLSIKSVDDYMVSNNFGGASTINSRISAIKLFYKYVIGKEIKSFKMDRPRKTKKLPYIIEQSVVINTLNSIKNKKHKAILYLAYSCGLRRSELINLKLSDFNKESHTIYIRNSKGQKDRVVALSRKTRDVLVEYYREFNPHVFLFNGQNNLQYSASSCANIMKRYFGKERHIHELRHCYASHCLDSGVDTRTLQATLGHNSPKTVAIYTHVSPKLIREAVAV